MAKPGQSSFRRILLSRILLLSVPVLLLGEAVTFKKARSSLLETASQNLTESAVRKGKSISDAITALKANLFVASQTTVLQEGRVEDAQQFIDQLAPQLPTQIQCIQLTNPENGDVVASNCIKDRTIRLKRSQDWWRFSQLRSHSSGTRIYVEALSPTEFPLSLAKPANSSYPPRQLQLLLSAPVYDGNGQLRYVLSVQSALQEQEHEGTGSIASYTVAIDQNGTILANPIANQSTSKSSLEANAKIFRGIAHNTLSQNNGFPLFYFEVDGVELIAAYSAIPSPLPTEPGQKWIILAVMPKDNALYDLQEIKIILVVLTICLLGASLLATLYVARDLARPLEKLRDYALNVQSRQGELSKVPHNFKIRELNQLAEALDRMVERLQAWTEELETAWQEAQAANQLKSEFLATTSHELRTPLNGIIGCVRLVRDGCCDDREEELQFLQQADEAAIHLLGIINDLLDISKIEAGKLSVVIEPLNIIQAIKEVVNLQTVHIQQKNLQIIAPDAQQPPIMVQADPAKLKQVLLNIVGNAIKFTEKGSITIATQIELPDDLDIQSSPQVIVNIRDTGVGIDPGQQQKLFHPFVMVDGTTTRKFGGTGLGLAISRNLVELMGGSIKLYSAGANLGTTVAIALPSTDLSLLHSNEVKVSSYTATLTKERGQRLGRFKWR